MVSSLVLLWAASTKTQAVGGYQIYVSDEKSGDITVINGADHQVTATFPVGKRPRGLRVSPDGNTVYVALSGTPISAPPQLDAKGNPIGKGWKFDLDRANVIKDADLKIKEDQPVR